MKICSLFNISKIILIITLLNGCAAIPSNKIKLDNYPKVERDKITDLDISYRSTNKPDYITVYNPYKYPDPNESQVDDSYILAMETMKKFNDFKKFPKNGNPPKKCDITISTKVYWPMPLTCFFHQYISAFTLAIIPYYCQTVYEAKATLISTKDNKVLKEYYLKDKVHEVWSSLMLLAAIPIKPLRNLPSKDAGKLIVEQTISEAITRQILNDASKFEECKKK